VPGDVVQVSEYILANTKPDDYLFNRHEFMDGLEFYFLTGRRNPTRFDMISEILWRPQQREALDELQRNPPTLVIGTYEQYLGPDINQYLKEGWVSAASFGRFSLWRRK
jgi:hypothetical protein